MAIVDINFNPSHRQLRQFGVVCLIALPLLTWLWTADTTWTGRAAAAGGVLCGTGLIAPAFLRPVFLGLTIITLPIGLVAGEIAMLLLYFGVFLPMSVILRLAGRDSLQRQHQPDRKTYWQSRKQSTSVRSYYHQF